MFYSKLALFLPPQNAANDYDSGGANLHHLGLSIFGKPSEQSGRKVKQWNEKSGVNPEELGEYAEGDILFPSKLSKNGLIAETARWPDGVVPYQIDGYFTSKERNVIDRAIEQYHKHTCINQVDKYLDFKRTPVTAIVHGKQTMVPAMELNLLTVYRFRHREQSDPDWVSIVNGQTGCWSSVGRTGGRQEVNLQSPGCLVKIGTVIHELLHALGFHHEQNRWERDSYVTIKWQNIQKGKENNFKKADQSTVSGYGVPYDYGSVMHYSVKAFSQNGEPTISVLKESHTQIGQREGFSSGDLQKVQHMYNCPVANENKENGSGNVTPNNSHKEGLLGGLISVLFP